MPSIACPGLPGEWINGWLAAVGATVLDSRLRLCWTDEVTPVAVLASEDDPVRIVSEAWPRFEAVEDLPLAHEWRGEPVLGRQRGSGRRVPVEAFASRARVARGHPQSWSLSSSLTDLHVDENGDVKHAHFDPTAPAGTWLHRRLLRVHRRVTPSIEVLTDALLGLAVRIEDNGLGFDHRRLGSQSDNSRRRVDPVVESLAFFGLALLPVRGRGTDGRIGGREALALQRGWRSAEFGNDQEQSFQWPAWSQRLDRHGIDALLDIWRPDKKHLWNRVGVHAAWETVQYQSRGRERTRAFGSHRL